jgi:hypothetical protein
MGMWLDSAAKIALTHWPRSDAPGPIIEKSLLMTRKELTDATREQLLGDGA